MTKLINNIQSNMSADIKLSKVQINKILKKGGKLLMEFLPKLIKSSVK